jgi:hypothetical protein
MTIKGLAIRQSFLSYAAQKYRPMMGCLTGLRQFAPCPWLFLRQDLSYWQG